ncbi:MAG: phage baseplate assembly protein [Proteobacteria bacterium]|nr:phage baseplate assembly protein [Pseudomonadota bacterium]
MNNIEQSLIELRKFIEQSSREQQENLAAAIRFGIVKLIEDGKTQHCQVKTAGGEVINEVAFLEPYGFTSKPRSKSETLVFNVNANPGNNVVLNIGNRELRFKELKDGEVAMYDAAGNLLHFKNNGNIELKAAGEVKVKANKAVVDAQEIITTGRTKLAGGTLGAAFVGCSVEVDPQTHKGTITSGSTEVLIK